MQPNLSATELTDFTVGTLIFGLNILNHTCLRLANAGSVKKYCLLQ